MNDVAMNANEKRAAFSLAGIYSFRMLGLFMILPVFSLFAIHLKGATPELIGLALGIYGLTQACLQIPFGMLSDRIGRKPMIITGLLIFAIGSVVAATSHSIHGVIIGRALQGAGAVGSTIMALLADLTREEHRTKAMAVIGITIGLSFSVAMILGPVLSNLDGLAGIFWITAILALGGIILLISWVPKPTFTRFHRDTQPIPALFRKILKDKELLRLNFGIMCLHTILMATFVVIPIVLAKSAGLSDSKQWLLYLPVLVLAFIVMIPLVIIAEKRRRMKAVFLAAIALIIFSELMLFELSSSIIAIAISLFVFFTAFSLLEATLPSLLSKRAPSSSKGTAMGVYSTAQFFGIFLGGTIGGWLFGHFGLDSVFLASALVALIWFLVAFAMQQPRYVATFMLNLGHLTSARAKTITAELNAINGVHETDVIVDEGIAYLKIDNAVVDKSALLRYAAAND